jgi:type III secretory pathway component EscV
MKYYATHLTASELSILEEATTAALEQLGRSAVSDPHAFADAAISEDLMDALLEQIYDTADQAGPEEQHAVLVLSADLRDVARALLTAASSGLNERSMEAQEDGRLGEAALLLAQSAIARGVELRLTIAAIEREE